MKTIIFVIFLISTSIGLSQSEVDTSYSKIQNLLDSALNLCRERKLLDTALKIVDEQLDLLNITKTNRNTQIVYGLYIKGRIYEEKQNFDQEFYILDSVIHYSINHGLDKGFIYARCLVHFSKACLYSKDSNRTSLAYSPLMKSIDIFEKLNNKDNVLFAKCLLPCYYYLLDQYEEAEKIINSIDENLDSTYSSGYISFFYLAAIEFYKKLGIYDKMIYYEELNNRLRSPSTFDQCIFKLNSLGKFLFINTSLQLEEANKTIDEVLLCSNHTLKVSPKDYCNAINNCAEIIIRKNLAKISIVDSLLNEEEKVIKMNIDTNFNIQSNWLETYLSFSFLKGLLAIKNKDYTEFKRIVESINIPEDSLEFIKNLSMDHKELYLILKAHYYKEFKNNKLFEVISAYNKSTKKRLSVDEQFMIESELNQSLENEVSSKFDIFFELYDKDLLPADYTKFLYVLALQSKGLLFRKSKGITNNLLESTAKEDNLLGSRINEINLRIASSKEKNNIMLMKEKESLERRALKLYNTKFKRDSFNLNLLVSKLKSDEISIEFVKYKSIFNETEDQNKYLALIVDSLHPYPKYIEIGTEKQLQECKILTSTLSEKLVDSNLSMRGYGLRPIRTRDNKLFQLIWAPILAEFPNVKTIYFSTTGSLNRINLSTLKNNNGDYMFDKYNVKQVSSTYNLTNEEFNYTNEYSTALLVGGINYGISDDKVNNLNQPTWQYLKGTLDEVVYINNLMKKDSIKSILLNSQSATESLVRKDLGDSKHIIHFATHGFYESDHTDDKLNYYKINPMLQSKLVLANANIHSNVNDNINDGYLTAYDITNFDLSNTKLVVLSACETAIGKDVSRYESNYSLVRGFKIAGAKTIISTLWPVSDHASIQFMKFFYQNLLQQNKSISEAFKATQKIMMNLNQDSLDWSAFLLID